MLKFGIVGCGRISQKHVKALLDAKDAKLSAICDIKPETMSSLSEKIPFEVKKYLSYDDFLDSDIDVVSICTPSGLHAEMTIAAAKKKKHVLCEKPMAMTLEDADAMIKAHQNAGTFLIIVKQNRENPAIKLLKEAVDAGRFGKLLMANATVRWTRPQEYYDQDPWRGTPEMDGSVLFNQASHHIDLLQWFLGPVRSVKAYAEILDHDIKVADSAVAVLKFESGAIGCVEATTCTYPKNLEASITVLGKTGSVKIGGIAVNRIETWNFSDRSPSDSDIDSYSTDPKSVYGSGHKVLYQKVIDAILGRRKNPVDGNEGKKCLEIIHAIHKSADTGKEVFLK